MSLIARIDNVPLFNTIEEALAWGRQYDLTGYHTHIYQGQTGYMGGQRHTDIVAAMTRGAVRTSTGVTIQTTSASTSSGGGGY